MKQKWNGTKAVLILCAALGWWGTLYPELTLNSETCVVTEADGTVWDAERMQALGKDLYQMLCKADAERICYKSKLAEVRKKWIKKLQ